MQADQSDRTSVRYEPDEKPPGPLAFGLGLQLAILTVAGVVLTPAIVIRAAAEAKASSPGPYSPPSRSAVLPR